MLAPNASSLNARLKKLALGANIKGRSFDSRALSVRIAPVRLHMCLFACVRACVRACHVIMSTCGLVGCGESTKRHRCASWCPPLLAIRKWYYGTVLLWHAL